MVELFLKPVCNPSASLPVQWIVLYYVIHGRNLVRFSRIEKGTKVIQIIKLVNAIFSITEPSKEGSLYKVKKL